MPPPGRFHNRLDGRVTRRPFEYLASAACVGDENGRIARSSGHRAVRNRLPRDAPAGVDDFPHAESPAGAQVQFQLGARSKRSRAARCAVARSSTWM